MKIFTINNGNTNTTVGVFQNGKLQDVIAYKDYKKQKDDYILISSVGAPLDIEASYDLKKNRLEKSFFDMPVQYAKTLGDDRLLAAYYIYKNLKSNKKVILIDAGTFMTCDLISKDGFEGGHIFPGVDKFLSIYSTGKQLPDFTKKDINSFETIEYFPHSTKDAITEATKIYLKSSLENIIGAASPGEIILTGGNANDIEKLINLKVPFELNHHLVHLALALIHQEHLQTS